MFTQFYCSSSRRTAGFAWAVLATIVVLTLTQQVFALRLVMWNGRFFNRIQTMLEQGTTSAAEAQKEIRSMVYDYILILMPATIVTPMLSRLTREYTLQWRLTLMDTYASAWDAAASIEGASQRVQEDTKKFGEGVLIVFREILTALFALVVFTPLLLELSAKTVLPFLPAVVQHSWLVWLALTLAVAGLLVAAFVARKLVLIDIANQRVEATLRKRLVQAEAVDGEVDGSRGSKTPLRDVHVLRTPSFASFFKASFQPEVKAQAAASPTASILEDVRGLMDSLRANYRTMFNNFIVIDGWNSLYARGVIVLPFLLAAPSLFSSDPATRIDLGDLQVLRFVFFDVLFSLNAFAMHWPEINDLRATARRLHEFEERASGRVVDTNVEVLL